jgi:hypothetical protein
LTTITIVHFAVNYEMNAASTLIMLSSRTERKGEKGEKEQKTFENRANVLLGNAQKNHGDGVISWKEYQLARGVLKARR